MEGFVAAANISDFQSGQMKVVSIEGHEYLVARVEGQYYAADNRCPHMGGNLSKGELAGTVITCPRHGSQFDLKDGRVIRWTTWPGLLVKIDQLRSSQRSLRTYPVALEGEQILLKVTGNSD